MATGSIHAHRFFANLGDLLRLTYYYSQITMRCTKGDLDSFFFFTFIEVQLIYNVVLITVVQQTIQYVYRHSLYSFSLWFVIGY